MVITEVTIQSGKKGSFKLWKLLHMSYLQGMKHAVCNTDTTNNTNVLKKIRCICHTQQKQYLHNNMQGSEIVF